MWSKQRFPSQRYLLSYSLSINKVLWILRVIRIVLRNQKMSLDFETYFYAAMDKI